MAKHEFHSLTRLELTPVTENQELRFHLTFQSSASRQDTVEFRLSSDHAMVVLSALMGVQRKLGWPLPGRPSGKHSLRVVVDNSEE